MFILKDFVDNQTISISTYTSQIPRSPYNDHGLQIDVLSYHSLLKRDEFAIRKL